MRQCYVASVWHDIVVSRLCDTTLLCLQVVEIPQLKVTKKVKSMQMFKKPVEKAQQVGGWRANLVQRPWYPTT